MTYQQPGYQQPGYQAPPFVPRPVAPPLGRRQKLAAFWAGFVSVNLMTFGWALASVGVIFVLFILSVGFFGLILSGANPGSNDLIPPSLVAELTERNAVGWVVGAVIVGLVLVVAGVVASYVILKAGRMARPSAITWSSIGILIPVQAILVTIGSAIGQVTGLVSSILGPVMAQPFGPSGTGAPGSALDDALVPFFIALGASMLLYTAINGVVGWLIWWWMTHVFRPKAAV